MAVQNLPENVAIVREVVIKSPTCFARHESPALSLPVRVSIASCMISNFIYTRFRVSNNGETLIKSLDWLFACGSSTS
jgi:hypothetical protein